MKTKRCDVHTWKKAKASCHHCGTRICRHCRNYDRGRVLCPVCARAVEQGFAAKPLRTLRDSHEPSPLLAAVLSAVIPGLGQIYNGRIGKGILVFCLSFLFIPYVFGIVDAAVEANQRARRYRATRFALTGGTPVPALPAWKPEPPTNRLRGNALQKSLLRAAYAKGGELSVTEGVLETGATFDEVSKALDALLHEGAVDIDNRPHSGVVVYRVIGAEAGRPALHA